MHRTCNLLVHTMRFSDACTFDIMSCISNQHNIKHIGNKSENILTLRWGEAHYFQRKRNVPCFALVSFLRASTSLCEVPLNGIVEFFLVFGFQVSTHWITEWKLILVFLFCKLLCKYTTLRYVMGLMHLLLVMWMGICAFSCSFPARNACFFICTVSFMEIMHIIKNTLLCSHWYLIHI